MSDASTTMARRLHGGVRGACLGALGGLLWAATELAVGWGSGGIAPASMVATIAILDVALGAGFGLGAGVLAPGIRPGLLALVLTVGYAFVRVLAPPGVGSEAVVLGGGIVVVVIAARSRALARGGVLNFARLTVVGALGLLLGELWLAGHHADALRGVWLSLACLGLPVAALLGDAALGLVLRRGGLRVAAELAAVLVLAWSAGRPLDGRPLVDPVVTGVPPPPGSPDVVLVSLDTTRTDRLSTYGYERETSPNLTRLAAAGELYLLARSPAGWTLPAHASMMTGLFPRSHGAHLAGGILPGESMDGRPQVAYPLRPGVPTLAEMLRDRGYDTGAFVANFSYLYRDYGLARGFGVYDDAPGVLLPVRPPAARLAQLVWPAFGRKPFRTGREMNAAALAWLDSRPAGRPAFLFVNYMEPHQPWLAEPPHDRWVVGQPRAGTLARKNLYTHAVRPLDAETIAFINANYDGQVAAMDEALGELLGALEARGRLENTLVIVAGDHGELLGEHGQMGHMGRMLYEPLLRVPLVVKRPGPGQRRGVIDTPVQLVDLLPTVVQVVGTAMPDGVEGVALDGRSQPAYAEEGINPFLVARYGAAYDRSIRVLYDGPYKLISTSRGQRMLFDLATDPGEATDLAFEQPDRVQELTQRLELRAPHLAAAHTTEKDQ